MLQENARVEARFSLRRHHPPMRAHAFSFSILWSAAPSEASRHFSQDRQPRAKFFVAIESPKSRPEGGQSPLCFGDVEGLNGPRMRGAAALERERHRLKLAQ